MSNCEMNDLIIEEEIESIKESFKKVILDILNRNQTLSQYVQLGYIDRICQDELIKLNGLEVK